MSPPHARKTQSLSQQDTESTQIRGVPKSVFSGSQFRGDNGGGEEGRSRKKGGRKWGPKAQSRSSDSGTPII